MRKKELFEGMLIFAAGIMALIEGVRLIIYKDPHSVEDITGPGRYLIVVSVFMMITGVIYSLSHYRKSRIDKPAVREEKISKISVIVVILLIYIVLIYFIGYFWATLIFFFLIHRVMGFKSWLINIIASTAISLILYLIFVSLFNMTFPRGVFFS